LDQINKLFAIERELKQVSPEERLKARELRSRPVVEGFRKWLDDITPMIAPKSLLGVAVQYGITNGRNCCASLKMAELRSATTLRNALSSLL
jgi:transposase